MNEFQEFEEDRENIPAEIRIGGRTVGSGRVATIIE